MPDNEIESRDEKLLILPLGEESKKITQVISGVMKKRSSSTKNWFHFCSIEKEK
jgi:hypothetical protein